MLFFYGLPGTGKTYIIEGFVSSLMDKGYKYISLKGSDIHSSLVGVGEKIVNIAFQEAIDNAPCVLFIDEVENVCVNRNSTKIASHEKRLTVAFLEARNALMSSDSEVILLGATNYPHLVDKAMMDRITPISVPLPDKKARAKYFESIFKDLSFDELLTFDYMANGTDNYSYGDLGKIVSMIQDNFFKKVKNEYAVYDDNGQIDSEASDDNMSNAVKEGKISVTIDMFKDALSSYTPSDKSENLRLLKEFENRLSKVDE